MATATAVNYAPQVPVVQAKLKALATADLITYGLDYCLACHHHDEPGGRVRSCDSGSAATLTVVGETIFCEAPKVMT